MRPPFMAWLTFAPALVVLGCAAFPDEQSARVAGESIVAQAYPGMPEVLTRRAVQDPPQRICSKIGPGKITQEEAAEVIRLSRASIKYPASGKLVGDWKTGAALAYSGVGTRVRDGKVEKVKENGALCSNCHMLDPREVNAGNLGPSLAGYGSQRGSTDAVTQYTYERIYNAWAFVPCSNMPRLGANGHLTPEQIAHVVAYLIDPQSPVNRK
ncbi:MAG TPA: sulfur oxidation c-type cytochrome SoxX [Burkholderiales bacterium]|nr:sulfur oxidation c-type cytochrome SoxX [Burkholderiales bacterium]